MTIKTEKMMTYPAGSKQEIFDYETLENNNAVVLCEGEFDKLVLEAHDIPAITFTGGASSFKVEWKNHIRRLVESKKLKEITVCYDNDTPGKKGADKAVKELLEIEGLEVNRIDLPSMGNGYKDVTDYLVSLKYSKEDLFNKYLKPCNALSQSTRIKKIDKSFTATTLEEWRTVIKANFHDFLFAAELILSVIAQILILDITNPFALVLIDVPSAGKTITINFFSEIEELVYMTDKFTPASFVSNATNVKKADLSKIDLLPKIRYKLFGVRDLAPLFGQRDDDLLESVAILIRVLDGEGFLTDTGVHGGRGYKGDYSFVMLAGSTPIQPRVWKLMGNLGARLYFLNMNSKDKSEDELANQLADEAYKAKEVKCRQITRDFLYTLWKSHEQGVTWDKSADDIEDRKIISRSAMLLARLRGTINIWKEKSDDGQELSHTTPIVEKPDRINQHLYNLARGHALVCGRSQINKDDLRFVIEIAFDSAPSSRSTIFKKLIDSNGQLATGQVEVVLRCSNPTALKEMEKLKILGVVYETPSSIGSTEKIIKLSDDLEWFLSEECKELRGIPLPPKQRKISDLPDEY